MMMIDRRFRDTVLIVDDTPSSLGMLTDALEEAGYTVLVAIDGERALDLVRHVTPNAVLMDAVLPGLSGFETSLRLKKLDALFDVPVLFMTGLSDTEHIIQGLEAGGVDYITKPINPAELIARLRVHLANARNSQSARLALDVSGRFLLSVDRDGVAGWATPQARVLLGLEAAKGSGADIAAEAGRLPAAARDWLGAAIAGAPRGDFAITIGGTDLRLAYLGEIAPNEHLLRVLESSKRASEEVLRASFDLTEREAEVLTWITNGKSNKEIAAVLDMSPRTVNKHLDRIFAKLGVENRTAAAILSLQAIMRDDTNA